jgi:uncharacterized protein (TIGR02271 family)
MAASGRSTVVGVFNERDDAERAIDELKRNGFSDDQIGFAAKDGSDREGTIRSGDEAGDAGGGAAAGALTGGVVGGVLGALAAGLIPGIGPIVAGGLLAGVLGGAAAGATAGGIIGALAGMGVPEEDARYYEGEFKGGRTLVTVKADGRYDDARRILHKHGAYDVDSRDTASSGMAGTTSPAGMTHVSDQGPSAAETRRVSDADSLELREEELAARKERTDAGSVQVEKDVVTEHRSVEVPVTREEVVVERRPVDRRPADRPVGDDEEIEIDVSREEVTAEKRAVVYEEVELGKRTTQDTERVEADVRREVAEIRRTGDAPVSGDIDTGQAGRPLVWDDAMPSYRQRWQRQYGTGGGRWEDAEPGYRYGYELANDHRYRDRDWRDVETDLGSGYSEWSHRNGYRSDSSTWERVRDNAREAWEDARVKARGR